MSNAEWLADKCGAIFDENTNLFVLDDLELEVFYHAARAEALREAADEVNNRYHLFMEPEVLEVVIDLRAMADREGK